MMTRTRFLKRQVGRLRPLRAWMAGLALMYCAGLPAQVQPPMVTLRTNGFGSNRLNVVFLSEGYQTNQLGQFLADATNALKNLLSHPPYSEYSNYFNAYAIKVASTNSGSDHPSYPSYKNTYFNSSYDGSDTLITIPPNFADANASHGQGKVDALLQAYLPNYQLAILLVNDTIKGGSDGFDKTAIAAASPSDPTFEILTHETAHVLANLGDEYTGAYPGFPNTEEPNTTQQTNFNSIKWKGWIDTNATPIPTPPTFAYQDSVGLFQGAHYNTTGWYRPQLNCAMGNFSSPFCAVCSEALVLAVYQRVRPVDGFTPSGTNISVTTSPPLAFTLTLLQPSTHSLNVQWFTNGTALAGATNPLLTLLPESLGNKTSVVSAVVRDYTPLVRTDPTNFLSQTVSWKVVVNIPQLNLDTVRWLSGGRFAFRVTGNAPQNFVIQGSTNLSNWIPLATNSLVGGSFSYTNTTASAFPMRYFRAKMPP